MENLRDAKERELLAGADIIWGVDSFTGDSFILYGKALIEEIIATQTPMEAGTVSYLYDSRTDQKELLAAAVELVKGSYEFFRVVMES